MEHWLQEQEVNVTELDDYVLGTNNIHGGTIIFVRNSVCIRKLDLSNYCDVFHLEVTGILLEDYKLIILGLTIYRPTSGNFNVFFL